MNEQPPSEPTPEAPAPAAPSVAAVPAGAESSGYDSSATERIEREFGEVEAALTRLDEGRYGICEVTGDRIGDELLAADPVRRQGTPAHS